MNAALVTFAVPSPEPPPKRPSTPEHLPEIDPDAPVPDDPGPLLPDTPETLPPAPVEPSPAEPPPPGPAKPELEPA